MHTQEESTEQQQQTSRQLAETIEQQMAQLQKINAQLSDAPQFAVATNVIVQSILTSISTMTNLASFNALLAIQQAQRQQSTWQLPNYALPPGGKYSRSERS